MADWCTDTKYTIYLQYPTDLPVNHQSTDNNAQYKQTSTIITNIYINDCNTIIITEGSQSHSWVNLTDGLPWQAMKTKGANTRCSPQPRVPKDNILCRKVDVIVPPRTSVTRWTSRQPPPIYGNQYTEALVIRAQLISVKCCQSCELPSSIADSIYKVSQMCDPPLL